MPLDTEWERAYALVDNLKRDLALMPQSAILQEKRGSLKHKIIVNLMIKKWEVSFIALTIVWSTHTK